MLTGIWISYLKFQFKLMNKTAHSITPRKTPAQGRAKEKVHRILLATTELLGVNTGENITTNHIATAAGVNVATLYQYFPNKQAIFYAICCEWLDKITIGYDRIEKQYFLKVGWREFFTFLRQSNEQVSYGPITDYNLDRMIESIDMFSELDRLHAEKVALRMTRYLKGYGSKWSKPQLVNLSMLIYEVSWAAIYRYPNQSEQENEQTRKWSLIAVLALIEHCLDE
jgi:AcrR family transcriptional regulator